MILQSNYCVKDIRQIKHNQIESMHRLFPDGLIRDNRPPPSTNLHLSRFIHIHQSTHTSRRFRVLFLWLFFSSSVGRPLPTRQLTIIHLSILYKNLFLFGYTPMVTLFR